VTIDSGTYQQQLLLALRLRDIPGPRIAEALAEVDSHVADTGEDPYESFGPPEAYADRLAEAMGVTMPAGHRDSVPRALLRAFTWRDGIIAGVAFTGTLLLLDGISENMFWTGAVGLSTLAALGLWLLWYERRSADRVLDPRTGTDMVAPIPVRTLGLLLAVPIAMLVIGTLVITMTG
jgi:hypothetical protein